MKEFFARLRFRIDHRWAPDRMSAYLDGGLAGRQRGRMERHVGECPECRRLIAGLTVVIDALQRLPSPTGGGAVQIATSVRARLTKPPGS